MRHFQFGERMTMSWARLGSVFAFAILIACVISLVQFRNNELRRSEIADQIGTWTSPNEKQNAGVFYNCTSAVFGKPVTGITIFGSVEDIDFPKIGELRALTSVFLFNSRITSFRGLDKLEGLEYFVADCPLVTDIEPLSNCKSLEYLDLRRLLLANDIGPISNCRQLREVSLDNVKSRSLIGLRSLPNLTALSVTKCQIADLSSIAYLHNLESLTVENTSSFQSDYLRDLLSLSNLNVRGLSSSSWEWLANFNELEALCLADCNVVTLDLSNNKYLRRIDISNCPVSSLEGLESCLALEDVCLAGTKVANIQAVANMRKLKNLNLSHTRTCDISPLKTATVLEVLDCSNTSVSDIKVLAGMSQLRELVLCGSPVSDASALAFVKSLESLDLSHTEVVDFSAIGNLPNLEIVNLSGNCHVDLEFLRDNATIKELILTNSTIENPIAICQARALRYVDFRGTIVNDVARKKITDCLKKTKIDW